jgi:hypothetical protein
MPQEQPRTHNQKILANIEATAKAADTPQNRLLSELRGTEETLLYNHVRFARLRETAEQLGIKPPVMTPAEIIAKADSMLQAASHDASAQAATEATPLRVPLFPLPTLTGNSALAESDPARRAQFQQREADNTLDH